MSALHEEVWLEFPRNYNAADDFVSRNCREGRGGNTAFIDPARSLTYDELQDGVNRFANALREMGIQREQRVALIMLDTVDLPIAFWGAIQAGVVPIPMNTLLASDQYEYMLNDSRAVALVVSGALLPKAEGLLGNSVSNLSHVIVSEGEPHDGGETFTNLLAKSSDRHEIAETCCDETAFWLYSSGSTGASKGVRHLHSSLAQTAKLFGQDVVGVKEDDVTYSAAKIFFAYGLGNAMSFPMYVGATTILFPDRPTPDAVNDIMRKHQPTLFYGVPTLFTAMLADENLSRGAGSDRLRLCVSAGEPLPRDVGERWKAAVGADIIDGIGSTEMLHIFVSNRPDAIEYGASGTPVPGYAARIVDENDQDVADGDIGELIINGPSSGESYWNQREKSRHTFRGGWTYTGDKYRRENGLYYYCGRTDDMFKVSGIWVSPFDVESALMSHPSVLEAAVVAKEDDDGLLKPKAFIIFNDGIELNDDLASDLKEHVKSVEGPWKYPRWIEAVADLPKTATGKIQRFKLRDTAA
ncbi:MAG: benzoate-CoA ligase family protein [Pseudomonadota bacterium]